jgi:polyhydroxybutyrate depolymerase
MVLQPQTFKKSSQKWMDLLLFIFLLSACNPTQQAEPTSTLIPLDQHREPGDYREAIEVSGVVRTFTLHIPSIYQPGVPLPLVINIHWRGGTSHQQEHLSFMNEKADFEGFITANPQALGAPATWWPAPGPNGEADLVFIREMIHYLKSQLSIDPARIFATGLSNGGAMANRLGCTLSAEIAAIAPVAGAHPQMETCEPTRPMPVIIFHGDMDSIVPYLGDGNYLPPVPAWAGAWANRNDCNPTPVTEFPSESIKKDTWDSCAGNATVILYTVHGGRHDWPGSGFGPGPYPVGLSPELYATDLIWEFFAAHPRN